MNNRNGSTYIGWDSS